MQNCLKGAPLEEMMMMVRDVKGCCSKKYQENTKDRFRLVCKSLPNLDISLGIP